MATRTRNPKSRLNKQSVVGARAPRVAGLTRKQRRNPRPLLVAQNTSIQAWSPFSNLESDFAPERNPSHATECQHALVRLAYCKALLKSEWCLSAFAFENKNNPLDGRATQQ